MAKYGFMVRGWEKWSVYLPHQCDDWQITDGYVNHAQAIKSLEDFISEAQDALEALRNKESED